MSKQRSDRRRWVIGAHHALPPDVEGPGDARRAVAAEDAGADALGRAPRRAVRLGVPDPVRLALPPAAVLAGQRRREVAQRLRRRPWPWPRRRRHRERRRQRHHRRRPQHPQHGGAGPPATTPAAGLDRHGAGGRLRWRPRRPHRSVRRCLAT